MQEGTSLFLQVFNIILERWATEKICPVSIYVPGGGTYSFCLCSREASAAHLVRSYKEKVT